jgi:hypothetical protein
MMLENGSFDPALCPLLQNLSPEEIAERLKEPQFQASMALADGGDVDEHTKKGRPGRAPCLAVA